MLAKLEAELIPVGSINRMDEVFSDPHVAARGLVIEQPISDSGATARLIGNPIKFSRTPISYFNAPPRLGEHSEEVLGAKFVGEEFRQAKAG